MGASLGDEFRRRARWEIDLSPGGSAAPSIRPGALIVFFIFIPVASAPVLPAVPPRVLRGEVAEPVG